MKNVSELNGLEFAELLHDVCQRLKNENESVVEIDRPCGEQVYIVLVDHETTFAETMHTEDGNFVTIPNAYLSSNVKL